MASNEKGVGEPAEPPVSGAPRTSKPAAPPPTTSTPPTPPARKPPEIKRTRVSALWIALIVGLVVLVVLLVFILQNLDKVTVAFLFWEFTLPLGVGVLLAAIGGAVIMAVVGATRIYQVRKVAKHA
ncbi:MAG TPA: lipopolysaccharide assembly protein LapA domain-containing protein [Aldersonia sp.]